MNLLTKDQLPLSELCSRPSVDKFIDEHVLLPADVSGGNGFRGCAQASVVFECRAVEQLVVGSHRIAIAAIEGIHAPASGPPLLYGQGRYMLGVDLGSHA